VKRETNLRTEVTLIAQIDFFCCLPNIFIEARFFVELYLAKAAGNNLPFLREVRRLRENRSRFERYPFGRLPLSP